MDVNSKAAVKAAPRSVEARYALAAARHQSGRLDGAAASYREALRLDLDPEPSRRGPARALMRRR